MSPRKKAAARRSLIRVGAGCSVPCEDEAAEQKCNKVVYLHTVVFSHTTDGSYQIDTFVVLRAVLEECGGGRPIGPEYMKNRQREE